MEETVSCVYICMLISALLTTLLLPRHKQTELHKHEKSIQSWGSREREVLSRCPRMFRNVEQ